MADVVTDASVWISYFMRVDALHAPTKGWFGPWLVARNRVITPWFLLAEVAGAIARRSGQPFLGHRAALTLRTSSRVIRYDLDEALSISAATIAADLRIRGSDAVYVALADRLGLPLLTWDQEQLTRAATVIQTRTP